VVDVGVGGFFGVEGMDDGKRENGDMIKVLDVDLGRR
jgi:hypothetical protein